MKNLSLRIHNYLDEFLSKVINIECYNFECRNNNVRISFYDEAYMQYRFYNLCNVFIDNVSSNFPIKRVHRKKRDEEPDDMGGLMSAEMIITFYY